MPSNRKTRKRGKSNTCSPYSTEDYNSNDGMLTTVWGPSQWHFLHTMSFNYPVEPTPQDKKHYLDYIYSLRYTLPCGKCRANLHKNLKKLPLKMSHMASRDTFSRYVYDLHELINKMLNKKPGPSYEKVRDTYENFRSRCTQTQEEHKIKALLRKTLKTESGCTKPLYGKKAKCILRIVPQEKKTQTFEVDNKCVKKLIKA
jgi:hypothetical protein